jgi:hypothetical protein
VKVVPGFLEEFYDFRTSVTNFLDIGVIEDAFILALIKHFPDMTRKQAANILNTNIPDAKVKLYYSMLASFILKAKNGGLEFLEFLQFFDKLEGVLLYSRDEDKSRKILHISTLKQVKLEKMAIAL